VACNSILTSLTSTFRGIRKRTKRAYLRLYDQPNYLFGRGTRTTIFPNGARELWIKNVDGTVSFSIRASDGPAGFGLSILAHVGTLPVDVHSMKRSDYRTVITPDCREITCIAYYPDAYSQQYRTWYMSDAKDEHGNKTEKHPDELGLVPRVVPIEAVE